MINYRTATDNDINEILILNNELCKYETESGFDVYIKNWSLSQQSREYFLNLINNSFVILAETEKDIVGYLAGSICEHGAYSYYEGKTAELENMFVKPEFRKYGIGSYLIAEFENWCTENGAKRIMVTASNSNNTAINFYRKNHFKDINLTLKKELCDYEQMNNETKRIVIYTDGACSGNPGVGGWGAVLFYKGTKKEISGVESETTNNRMELTAAVKALEMLKDGNNYEIDLYSDSAYLINAFKEDWITKWQLNGFKNANKKEVANIDLWQQIIGFNNKYKINWIKVKGHADNEYNNRCDELATGEIAKFKA